MKVEPFIQMEYIIILFIYFAITIGIGVYYGRKKTKSHEDFMVGGRQFGIVLIFFTMLATYIGAGTTIGTTAWVWKRGLSQAWFTLGYAVVFTFIGLFMAGKIRKFGEKCNAYTFADFLEIRFGKLARFMGAGLMWFAFMAVTAYQYIGMGRIITSVTGLNYTTAILISALITIVYTSIGGLWSVAITEVFQGALTVIGVVTFVPILLHKAGGFSNIVATVPAEHLTFTGYVTPAQALTWFMVFFLGLLPMQDWWQRAFAAKDEKSASKGIFYMAIGFVFVEVCIFIIGFAGKSLLPNLVEPEELFPTLVMDFLNPIMGGILLAALISIIMSTAAACLLVPSTHFTRDFYQVLRPKATNEELLKVSKWSTLLFGIGVLVFVFVAPGMFELWVLSADVVGATAAVPIIAGFFVPQVSKKAGSWSMIAGFIGWLLGYLGWEPFGLGAVMVGAIFSLIVIVGISLVSRENNRDLMVEIGILKEKKSRAGSNKHLRMLKHSKK